MHSIVDRAMSLMGDRIITQLVDDGNISALWEHHQAIGIPTTEDVLHCLGNMVMDSEDDENDDDIDDPTAQAIESAIDALDEDAGYDDEIQAILWCARALSSGGRHTDAVAAFSLATLWGGDSLDEHAEVLVNQAIDAGEPLAAFAYAAAGPLSLMASLGTRLLDHPEFTSDEEYGEAAIAAFAAAGDVAGLVRTGSVLFKGGDWRGAYCAYAKAGAWQEVVALAGRLMPLTGGAARAAAVIGAAMMGETEL